MLNFWLLLALWRTAPSVKGWISVVPKKKGQKEKKMVALIDYTGLHDAFDSEYCEISWPK